MTDKELLQQALDALEKHIYEYETIQAIKARLAQPEKEWVGLTDEEIKDSWSQLWYDLNNGKFAASDDPSRHTTVMFARALEAKLKEKNT